MPPRRHHEPHRESTRRPFLSRDTQHRPDGLIRQSAEGYVAGFGGLGRRDPGLDLLHGNPEVPTLHPDPAKGKGGTTS